jgi:DNA topoisomerase-6 subunit B
VFLRRRERAKSEFRRRNIFELYIEEVVEACARLKGGKLAKEKLKDQLQKIATKRTGGEKTDEILGHDGGGPEGLPHSIIVTAEGTEGDAPTLDSRSEAPAEEFAFVEEETAATPPKGKAGSQKKVDKKVKSGKRSGKKPTNERQMTLGFEATGPRAARGRGTGRKNGVKKGKK